MENDEINKKIENSKLQQPPGKKYFISKQLTSKES